jgi:hypothetical protein
MKVGSVLRLRNKHRYLAENHGWLWVYEGMGGYEEHSFRSVATGYSGHTTIPSAGFENWYEDNDAG